MENKQETLKEPKQDRTCNNNCSVVCGECQIFEPKQETLEEALNRFKEEHTVLNLYPSNILQNIAEFGAKWQQERSYSEEEVLDLLCARNIEFNLYEGRDEVEKWFKQFKKKTN